MRVVAIVAAYNEADVLGQVIEDLIRQGVFVYLIDHGSNDGTVEVARPFLGHGLIGIEEFPGQSGFDAGDGSRFAWEHLLKRKETLAVELEGDWFLHTDADELRESPWDGVSLKEGIERVDALGYSAIDFTVFNFFPVDDSFRPGQDLRSAFPYYEPAGPHDRLQLKCWKRQRLKVDLAASGGHDVRFPGRRVFPVRFILRHYPIRSQAHGERKVFVERRPRFVPEERARSWHVQYDGIQDGHRFVRQPGELKRFDPELARTEAMIHHRGLEEVEARLAEAAQACGRAESALAQMASASQLERESRVAEIAQLRVLLDETRAECETLRSERERWAHEAGALYQERTQREAEIERLRGRVDETVASRDAMRLEREQWADQAGALYRERAGREAEIERLRVEVEEARAAQETLRAEWERWSDEVSAVARERDELLEERTRLAAEVVRHREESEAVRADRNRFSDEANRMYDERRVREAELERLRERLDAIGQESQALIAARDRLAARSDAAEQAEVAAARADTQRWADEAGRLYAERSARELEIERLREQIDALREQNQTLLVERERWAQEAGSLYRERSEREAGFEALRRRHEALEAEHASQVAARPEAELERLRERLARVVEENQARVAAQSERDEAQAARAEAERALAEAWAALDQFYGSRTWRWSVPARLAWRLTPWR